MAKILISAIGAGFINQKTNKRDYQKACYKIDDKSYPDSTFIASVIYEHFKLDGIIFIGTVKSMWEEVYRNFCEVKQINLDEDYWVNLGDKINTLNHQSNLNELDLSPIKQVLGKHSECILIKYGLNQQELWENFDNIFQIVELLQPDDEIYIDITHSFRSLSLFQFLTTTFIKDLADEKNIKIAGVYYGMLDITRELGHTPIVDLKPLFDMTSWIKGAYSFKSYGDGYLIAQLLKGEGENQLAHHIDKLSQAININYVNEIKQQSIQINKYLPKTVSKTPFKYLQKILENFVKKFARSSVKDSQYQLDLAGWYFDNRRFATGYIILAEAIITYMCELYGKDTKKKYYRDEMKDILFNGAGKDSQLANLYSTVNPIRNSIAHALLEDTSNVDEAIRLAKNYYQQAKDIFKTETLNKINK